MVLFVVAAIVAALVVAVGIARFRPRAAERWVRRLNKARKAIASVWWLLLAAVGVASGWTPLVIFGLAVFLFGGLLVATSDAPLSRPWEAL